MTQIPALTRAIELLGGKGRTMNLLGISEAHLLRWMKGADIPSDIATKIEELTEGKVDARELAEPDYGRLPLEIGRCLGEHKSVGVCAERESCWRYIAREDLGAATPLYSHLCQKGTDQKLSPL